MVEMEMEVEVENKGATWRGSMVASSSSTAATSLSSSLSSLSVAAINMEAAPHNAKDTNHEFPGLVGGGRGQAGGVGWRCPTI